MGRVSSLHYPQGAGTQLVMFAEPQGAGLTVLWEKLVQARGLVNNSLTLVYTQNLEKNNSISVQQHRANLLNLRIPAFTPDE